MRVLITDGLDSEALAKIKAINGVDVDFNKSLAGDALKDKLASAQVVVIRSATTMNKENIAAAPNLKLIVRAGEGLDNVDVETAKTKGIKVSNTPGANNIAVAELAVGLMLSGLRHIPKANETTHKGEWLKKDFVGREIYKKTIGILGFGKIGKLLAKRLSGFDCEVVSFDPFVKDEKMARPISDINEFFKVSDIISIHVPKIKETTNLIDEITLQKCKKGVAILNLSRGGIVNEEAISKALDSGHVSFFASDVFAVEPVEKNNPLLGKKNFVCTPHIGASSDESTARVGLMVADIIKEFAGA